MAFWVESRMSTGAFLAFNAAFGGSIGAVLAMGNALLSLLDAVPIYERAKPILQATPEVDEERADPGELHGKIELSHILFRYHPDTPPVLNDLSFQVNPGEMVALVGPSGAGKSSLFRLLLGFETPEAGSIYYDGIELAGLDVTAVRRQFGVVLQNAKLTPGSIFENIVGSSLLTLEDACEAARRPAWRKTSAKCPWACIRS
jgi:ABC-type bacteriocin/lantibiotic exporter with double-glycine peptidase domain